MNPRASFLLSPRHGSFSTRMQMSPEEGRAASPPPKQGRVPSPPSKATTSTLTVICLLTCIPPITMEIYIPSLPSIEEALNVTTTLVLLSITVYSASFAVAQSILGPASTQITGTAASPSARRTPGGCAGAWRGRVRRRARLQGRGWRDPPAMWQVQRR